MFCFTCLSKWTDWSVLGLERSIQFRTAFCFSILVSSLLFFLLLVKLYVLCSGLFQNYFIYSPVFLLNLLHLFIYLTHLSTPYWIGFNSIIAWSCSLCEENVCNLILISVVSFLFFQQCFFVTLLYISVHVHQLVWFDFEWIDKKHTDYTLGWVRFHVNYLKFEPNKIDTRQIGLSRIDRAVESLNVVE
jgi:hypothetical protein